MTARRKVRVLVCPPEKASKVREVVDYLQAYQELVGGYIQTVDVTDTLENATNESVLLVCNEEGKLQGLPVNMAASAVMDAIGAGDVIVGTAFFVGVDKMGDFASLTDEEILELRFMLGEEL